MRSDVLLALYNSYNVATDSNFYIITEWEHREA